jgi:predicted RNA-binding protein with PUA-like domain
MATNNHWLVKSEPSTYSWNDLVRDKRTRWDGVRNFEARNNLRAMKKGDLVLFYHSGEGKEIVGIAKVVAESYPDATAKEGDWSVVDLAPHKPLARPVTLAALKVDKALANMAVVRKGRISVTPVRPEELTRILELAATKL